MSSSDLHVIVGLGATGLSCVRYLNACGVPIAVMDTRENPPNLDVLQKENPKIKISLGGLDPSLLHDAAQIILSPGVALREPLIMEQVKRGTPVVGDIELFARAVKQPVIAITGTNAKSTVTTLVGLMATAAGYHAEVGGNLGTPALDLLNTHSATNLYVLELSSFQLETTTSLKPAVATVLNVTPDHMDRYDSLAAYQQAKLRVYQHCHTPVCNRDDPLTDTNSSRKLTFTLNTPGKNEFGLITKNSQTYLAFEDQILLSTRELPVAGKHYHANALASLAIGYGFGMPMEPMLNVLREFEGLAHRCQFVRDRNQVRWFNDSKGTNVGATQAAIEGLGSEIDGKLILILGGIGKHADFSPLVPLLKKYARHAVLIGEAAEEMAKVIGQRIPTSFAKTMEEAVQQCDKTATPGDCVLLSPACASFDMFNNFAHRGDVFMEIVRRL